MNWSVAIAEAEKRLYEAEIDESRLNAELIAAHVLGVWTRGEVDRLLDRLVTDSESGAFNELVNRRIAGEPLQYIVGETEFYGIRLLTTPAALIPRPETELLVEEILRELKSRNLPSARILDIGTGTGAIALSIASHIPAAHIVAVDRSAEAIQLAKENRLRLAIPNVEFIELDIFHDAGSLGIFDVVVSNPPYIAREEIQTLDRELREHEPRIALTDESDGLSFYRRIGELAPVLLSEGGLIAVEMGFGASADVSSIMRAANISLLRIVNDLAGIPRVFLGERSSLPPGSTQHSALSTPEIGV